MDLSNLHPAKGARRARKRIGRGPGSGTGKTAARGHKGRGARAGGNTPPTYEGGQMPLQRRLPKRGFRSPNRRRYTIVKVGQLERFEDGATVDAAALVVAGLARAGERIKLLADGALSRRLTVKVDAASGAARERVTAAGGTVEVAPDHAGNAPAVAQADGAGKES
ncbi:MAG: 50S ribosomal protein L15 [Candidatus Binatia bacterium]